MISQFGFQPDGEGVIQFNQHIKLLEHEDQEVGLNTMLVNNRVPCVRHPGFGQAIWKCKEYLRLVYTEAKILAGTAIFLTVAYLPYFDFPITQLIGLSQF